MAHCAEAMDACLRVDCSALRVLIGAIWGAAALMDGALETASARLAEALELCDAGWGPRYRNVLLQNLALVTWRTHSAERAIPYLQETVDVSLSLGDISTAIQGLLNLAEVLIAHRQLEPASKRIEQALRLARDLERPMFEGYGQLLAGRLELARHQPERALEQLVHALERLETVRFTKGVTLAQCELATACLHLHQLENARHWIDQAYTGPDQVLDSEGSELRARLHALEERLAQLDPHLGGSSMPLATETPAPSPSAE